MPNRRGQQVATPDAFRPQGAIADGMAAITRPDGSDEAAVAKSYAGLADEAGKWADQAAKIEGARAGGIAGNDPAWRPTGSTTLRGAASDAAGISTYIDNLDAKTRSAMTDAFTQNQNDPAALKSALDGIKADALKNDVFPEIAGHFNSSFERLRVPFQVKAAENQLGLQRDQARASAVTATSQSETYRAEAARADPNGPATRQAVEQTLAEDDLRDKQMVASEAMSAEEAAKRSVNRRRNAEVTLYSESGNKLTTPDDVRAYRDRVQKEFTDGKTKLDADGMTAVDAALTKREQQLRTLGRQEVSTVSGVMDTIIRQHAEGIPVSPAEISAAREKAATLGPEGAKALRSFDGRLLINKVAQAKSPAELDQMADFINDTARREGRGLTTEEGERLEYIRTAAATKRKALGSDPTGYAARQGLVTIDPLVIPKDNVADSVGAQMVARVAAAKSAAEATGAPVRYFTPNDKQTLKFIADADPSRALQAVRGIVQSSPGDAKAILKEIGGDMPELAKAGDLLVNGGPGSDVSARDIANALDLRKVKDAKLPGVPRNATALQGEVLGGAYLKNPESQAQLQAGAKAIYQTRTFGRAIDPNSSEGQEIYRDSLRSAAGGGKQDGVTYGGVTDYKPGYVWNYKVAIPPNVRQDRFRDVVGSIRDQDLGGATDVDGNLITARQVKGAIPVRTQGGYAFSLDDPKDPAPRFLGKPGAPLIVDLDKLEPDLRQRVPGAYFGGATAPAPAPKGKNESRLDLQPGVPARPLTKDEQEVQAIQGGIRSGVVPVPGKRPQS